uniref:Uncharacterized protein n=1 Tax=Glossina austeni TaxID=7395 RepID=A0A1A9VV41_GLOAU
MNILSFQGDRMKFETTVMITINVIVVSFSLCETWLVSQQFPLKPFVSRCGPLTWYEVVPTAISIEYINAHPYHEPEHHEHHHEGHHEQAHHHQQHHEPVHHYEPVHHQQDSHSHYGQKKI